MKFVYIILFFSISFSQECTFAGDSNIDDIVNIIDIIDSINCILDNEYYECSDTNRDQIVDIVDIVLIIDIILSNILIEQFEEENLGYSYLCYPNVDSQFPIVLYNHGGLGNSVGGDLFNTCKSLAEIGYLTKAEKRQETITLDGHLEEVVFALNNLKNHEKADSSRIGIVGFSRGGLLSLQVGIIDDDVTALALLAPATGNGLINELYDSFNLINSSVLIQISENDASPDNLVNISYDIYNLMLQYS
ncbi:uncharacterized protein METZ01_LOCUS437151, partial [marine metagenome]